MIRAKILNELGEITNIAELKSMDAINKWYEINLKAFPKIHSMTTEDITQEIIEREKFCEAEKIYEAEKEDLRKTEIMDIVRTRIDKT